LQNKKTYRKKYVTTKIEARVSKGSYSFNNISMLWTIAVILIILWLLGLITSYTMGGFIHVLLVVAIIVILIRLIRGEKVV